MFGFFDPSAKNQKKFLKAVLALDVDAARECLAKGADINKGAGPGDDPPIMQVMRRAYEVDASGQQYIQSLSAAAFLAKTGARLDCVDDEGHTPLRYLVLATRSQDRACLKHFREVLNLFLDGGLSFDDLHEKSRYTSLHLAASKGCVSQVLEELAKRQAAGKETGLRDFIDRPGWGGNTALHISAFLNDAAGIRALIKHGADPALKNDNKEIPLDIAEDFNSVYALLEGKDAIKTCLPSLPSVVDMAVTENNTAFLDFLKEKGVPPSSLPECRAMDLPRRAVRERSIQALGWLLENGFDGSRLGPDLFPLVETAVGGRSDDFLELVKNSGIDLAAVPGAQDAAFLQLALEEGNDKAFLWLLKNGFDPDRPDRNGDYPLHLAVQDEDAKNLARLLEFKASADVTDGDGSTPLFRAVWRGNVAAVEALLKAGADPCRIDADGNTLLHTLVHSDDCSEGEAVKIARHLLEAGCDPSQKNGDGYTVRELAKDADVDGLLRLLGGFARAQKKKAGEQMVTGDTITFVRALPEKRVLVESFNFAARERTVIMENHALKAISAPACESFDVIRDKSVLEKAHEAYAAAGGKIPREVIHAPPRRMEPLLPPRK